MRWRALAAAALIGTATAVQATPPNIIIAAEYTEPTTRYDHGVLGDAVEWGALRMTVDMCQGCPGDRQIRTFTIRLPKTRVFEDLAPRLVHVPEEAGPLVMVVETDLDRGARLALYTESGLTAATPFIGTSNRWLAPVGAADLDGDGYAEIAYVDRPHLARTLRVWRYDDGTLTEVAALGGLSNHRIGEDFISGGIRDCGQGPEIVTADAGWQQVMATRLTGATLQTRPVAALTGPDAFQAALDCR